MRTNTAGDQIDHLSRCQGEVSQLEDLYIYD